MEILIAIVVIAAIFFAFRKRKKEKETTEAQRPSGVEISVRTFGHSFDGEKNRSPDGPRKPRHEQNPSLEKLVLPEDERVAKWVGWSFCGHVEVSGVHHYKQAALEAYTRYRVDSEVALVRDPTNKYDKNAIKVLFGDKLVGYIDKETAGLAAKYLSDDMPIRAKYKRGWLSNKGYLELAIQPLMPDAKSRGANGWVATPRRKQR